MIYGSVNKLVASQPNLATDVGAPQCIYQLHVALLKTKPMILCHCNRGQVFSVARAGHAWPCS